MATNLSSSEVSAGDDATPAQYNSLRTDVIVNAGDYEDSAGSSNAYTLSIDSAISAYAAGQKFRFKATFANTAAATLNVNSIGAVTIKKNNDEDLTSGDIENGQIVDVTHDGTNFQMVSPVSSMLDRGDKDTLTDGATSDAEALHYHSGQMSTGQTSRTGAAGTGTQNIAHGLGVVPSLVIITAYKNTADSVEQTTLAHSKGTATSTSDETCTYGANASGLTSAVQTGQDATHIINLVYHDGTVRTSATLSTLDATNITLNFDVNNGDTGIGDTLIQWVAFK